MTPQNELEKILIRLQTKARLAWQMKSICISAVVLLISAVAARFLISDYAGTQTQFLSFFTMAFALAMVLSFYLGSKIYKTREDLAKFLEESSDDLNERLYTAMELIKEDRPLNIFEMELVKEVLRHKQETNWETKLIPIPLPRLRLMLFAAVFSFILSTFMASKQLAPIGFRTGVTTAELEEKPQIDAVFGGLEVEPGNTEIQKGRDLLVTSRFNEFVPATVELVKVQGKTQSSQTMKKGLGDPLFGATVLGIEEDFRYYLTLDFHGEKIKSDIFTVTVFEYPKLLTMDASLTYPEYLEKDNEVLEDVRSLNVPYGTKVDLTFKFNKDVKKAVLEGKNSKIELVPSSTDKSVMTFSNELKKSGKYILTVEDSQGRKNLYPEEVRINVYRNKAPKIKVTFPGKDMKVSPLAELDITAEISDDRKVLNWGIDYDFNGMEKSVSLGSSANIADAKTVALHHPFEFEKLGAQPNDLLSWKVWAEDTGDDGKVRRTFTDIYFIEIRFLEEIVREMQMQGEGQSQEQQQSEQLVEIQKQVISATWKQIQKLLYSEFDDKMAENVNVVVKAETELHPKILALKEKLPPNLHKYLDNAAVEVLKSVEHLKQSLVTREKADLEKALKTEQMALKNLISLNSKLKMLTKSQSQSQSSSRSQQQRQRLNMDEKKKPKYEAKKEAQKLKEEQRKEDREILNALKELAQRQLDLNKQIKDVMAALEQEKDPAKEEELERQLKRLREEQEQLARDLEKVQDRANEEKNRERLAEESKKLEEIRKQMKETADKLEKKERQQTVNAGRRAEKSLNELKEQVQKKTANEFEQEMRELKTEARELKDKLGDIKEETAKLGKEKPSLSGNAHKKELEGKLNESQNELSGLQEKIKQTIQESENSQAALANELYQALRDTNKKGTQGKLEESRQNLKGGQVKESARKTEAAEKDVNELAQAIDKAAEKVLGDEFEGLKKAKEELDKIRRQVSQQMNEGQQDGQQGEGKEQTEGQGQESQQAGKGEQGKGQESQQAGKGEGQNPSKQGKGQESQQAGKGEQGQGQQGEGKGEGQGEGKGEGQGEGKGESQQAGKGEGQGQGQESQQAGNQQGQMSQGQNQSGPTNSGGGNNPNHDGPINRQAEFREMVMELRNVEDMLQNQKLRQRVAGIRDKMRQMEMEKKRHSKKPEMGDIKEKLYSPLVELNKALEEEIDRLSDTEDKVRVDREPVPGKYKKQVQNYFDRLSSGDK